MLNYLEFSIMKNIKMHGTKDKDTLLNGYPGEDKDSTPPIGENEFNDVLAALEFKKYIKDFQITEIGESELLNYKVKNAIILAAGGDVSTKDAYSIPRGLYKVKRETVIERQIEQLKEAGIDDIYVVIGIKKERYYYLEEKYNIKLIPALYPRKGNVFSMYCVLSVLDNTYICNWNNYYTENPFELYLYDSFHATMERQDTSREYAIKKNSNNRITDIYLTKEPAECLYGHAYFTKEFSKKFKNYLGNEIFTFRVDTMYWQEFFYKHINDLDMYARKYASEFIWEFDSILELQQLDDMFIDNVGAKSLVKLLDLFSCKPGDIKNFTVLNKGFMNIISIFTVLGNDYIIRFPGSDADTVFKREKEVIIQKILMEKGLDKTCIYIDLDGLKVSRFVPNCVDLKGIYYKDLDFMKRLVEKVKLVHAIKIDKETQDKLFFDPR